MLGAARIIAGAYNGVLIALDAPPPLSPQEQEVIATAVVACCKRYGGEFKHWEAVALVGALSMPLVARAETIANARAAKKQRVTVEMSDAEKKE